MQFDSSTAQGIHAVERQGCVFAEQIGIDHGFAIAAFLCLESTWSVLRASLSWHSYARMFLENDI